MLLNCGVGEDSWESLGLQGDPTSPFWRRSALGISLEGMMLKLKLQCFGHLMRRVDSLEKTLMLGGIGGQEEKGMTEDEMAGWHHWLDGHESEWTPGVGDGQGGLVCCDSWGHKESDTTERLIWSDLIWMQYFDRQVPVVWKRNWLFTGRHSIGWMINKNRVYSYLICLSLWLSVANKINPLTNTPENAIKV